MHEGRQRGQGHSIIKQFAYFGTVYAWNWVSELSNTSGETTCLVLSEQTEYAQVIQQNPLWKTTSSYTAMLNAQWSIYCIWNSLTTWRKLQCALSRSRAADTPVKLAPSCADYTSEPRSHQNAKLHGLSPQANYTDWATAAVGEVVPTFAGRGCYVVSATDSHGR
jgi:hypothetical protein